MGLIAGKGREAVLPETAKISHHEILYDKSLPESSKIFYYGVLYDKNLIMDVRNNFLKKVREKSEPYPAGPSMDRVKKERKQIYPSFINFSMKIHGPEKEREDQEELKLQELLRNPPISRPDSQKRFPLIFRKYPDLHEKIKSKNFQDYIKWRLEGKKKTDIDFFNSLSPPSLLIVAAGNDAPDPVYKDDVWASKQFDAILVGSIDPDGEKSAYSQEHEEITILSPSGADIYSIDNQGQSKRFSGTSAAAPLVTGSLAGFEWLSDYHPTAKEAKLLLKNTAIPTKNSLDKLQKNGPGLLNAYKLGMVGKRLKLLCGKDPSCFKQKIKDPRTYEFPRDHKLKKDVGEAFPECNSSCGGVIENNCQNQKKVFERLRKAMFLNPGDKENHALLSCIYRSNGFEEASLHAEKSYRAAISLDKTSPKYGTCREDRDCVLVSDCKFGGYKALSQGEEALYYGKTCKKTMCGEDCGCGEEVRETKAGKHFTYSSKCRKGSCRLSTKTKPIPFLKQIPGNNSLENVPSPLLQETPEPIPAEELEGAGSSGRR